ncbi:MAG: helix-turn-helix domain-containing protein [Nitrospirae bacterium]|nr:helix-turn-helix domain-containing protein [Candidatus Manganitrophaceae bacterium]
MATLSMSRLLRVPEAARLSGLKEATIRKMIFQRRLPTVRIGRAVMIPEEAIEKLIREGYRPAIGLNSSTE